MVQQHVRRARRARAEVGADDAARGLRALERVELEPFLKLGRYGASLTEQELYRISKLVTQSSADLLEEWFEFDPLKGTKAASGIIGTYLGPRSPGTAYVLLHHYMGEIDGAFRAWGFAKNGTGGVTAAIASSARALLPTARPSVRVSSSHDMP